MEKLLVDVGNTAVKFAWYRNDILLKRVILNSDRLMSATKIAKSLEKDGIHLSQINLLALASVKPVWDKIIKKLARKSKIAFYQVKSNLPLEENFGIKHDDVQKIGADLLMSAYAGSRKYPHENLIVISFGTATTISLIQNNAFEGTIIMPGLKISGEALFERAALLEEFPYKLSELKIGKNTRDAINIGLVNGHLWAIKGLINNLSAQIKKPLILIMGNNNYQYELFFDNYKLEPNLVFEGLNFLLIANQITEK